MLEQFQNILEQPVYSQEQILNQTRNLILNALQNMFPPDFNFEGLAQLCNEPKIASNDALLTYHLVDYFLQLTSAHFVSLNHYEMLEMQTQKLESTIRSHIKLEQEVKMYLEHLEYKINKYQTYLKNNHKAPLQQTIPTHQETQLRKQRISLVRANEHLKRQLQEKEQQLKEKQQQLQEKMTQLERVKSQSGLGLGDLRAKTRMVGIKSEAKLRPQVKSAREKEDGFAISITGNHNQVNYYQSH